MGIVKILGMILGVLLLGYSYIVFSVSAYLYGQEIKGPFRQIFLRTFTLGRYDYD